MINGTVLISFQQWERVLDTPNASDETHGINRKIVMLIAAHPGAFSVKTKLAVLFAWRGHKVIWLFTILPGTI